MTLHDLLRTSDIVSVHAPYLPGTIGMLGAAEFALMKPSAIVVCTARPELMDLGALKSSLATGQVGTVALDGYYTEPALPPAEDAHGLPAFGTDQVIVTPHSASLTRAALRATVTINVGSIKNTLDGLDDPDVVNPAFHDNVQPRGV